MTLARPICIQTHYKGKTRNVAFKRPECKIARYAGVGPKDNKIPDIYLKEQSRDSLLCKNDAPNRISTHHPPTPYRITKQSIQE
jgi:hypothetical protein